MTISLIQIFEMNVILVLFAISYKLFYEKLSFYMVNRVISLLGLGLSLFIPIIADVVVETSFATEILLSQVPVYPESVIVNSEMIYFFYGRILGFIYLSGIAVMLISIFSQLRSLKRIEIEKTFLKDGIKVNVLKEDLPSFSFLRTIYLNKSDLDSKEAESHLKCPIFFV